MTNGEFVQYYSVLTKVHDSVTPLLYAIGFVIFAAALVIFATSLPGNQNQRSHSNYWSSSRLLDRKFMVNFSVSALCIGIAGTLFASFGYFIRLENRRELRRILTTNEYSVVEGYVKNFVPMPYSGHQNEEFTVNGVKFSYSDYDDASGGFNNAKSHGGPIDVDRYVRIYYYNGRILRLWVRE